jgi:multiple sugar transport system ATP-binding protein
MGFALKQARVPKDERMRRVREAARILEVEDLLGRKPKHLSGGQRQRVAMGRAIVREPQVFLMDEPLSNLDAKLRVQTRTELADLQARLAVTTVYVTHDQVEAMTMGHRVGVLREGMLQQVDTPKALYKFPANVFVAGFIGSPAMNLVETTVDGDQLSLGTLRLPIGDDVRAALRRGRGAGNVTVGVRPEDFRVASDGLPGEVMVVEELGSEAYLHVYVEHRGDTVPLVVRTNGDTTFGRGDHVHLAVSGAVHVFDDQGHRVPAPLPAARAPSVPGESAADVGPGVVGLPSVGRTSSVAGESRVDRGAAAVPQPPTADGGRRAAGATSADRASGVDPQASADGGPRATADPRLSSADSQASADLGPPPAGEASADQGPAVARRRGTGDQGQRTAGQAPA